MSDDLLGFSRFFKFKHTPFDASIPTTRLYQSTQLSECISRLTYAAHNSKFAVLTGPVGSGKSKALHAFKEALDPNRYLVLYLSESNLTPRWLYAVPLSQMKIEAPYFVNESKRQFHETMLTEMKLRNRRIVMIIDEAHLIAGKRHGQETLEEIRFMLNCQFDSGSPLCLVLCGQDELWELLDSETNRAVTQRIDLLCHMTAYDDRQVAEYIAAHLRYAGAEDKVFTAEAVTLISSLSCGIARLINKICTHALLYAASQESELVTADIVNEAVARELPQGMLRK